MIFICQSYCNKAGRKKSPTYTWGNRSLGKLKEVTQGYSDQWWRPSLQSPYSFPFCCSAFNILDTTTEIWTNIKRWVWFFFFPIRRKKMGILLCLGEWLVKSHRSGKDFVQRRASILDLEHTMWWCRRMKLEGTLEPNLSRILFA